MGTKHHWFCKERRLNQLKKKLLVLDTMSSGQVVRNGALLAAFLRRQAPVRSFHKSAPVRQAAATPEELAKQWPINFLLPMAGLFVTMKLWDGYKFTMNIMFPRKV